MEGKQKIGEKEEKKKSFWDKLCEKIEKMVEEKSCNCGGGDCKPKR
jgi:hypothetical protein